jgi:hypothetical protein
VRHQIEHTVVPLAGAREVLRPVVDNVIRAERPHEVELAGVVDARDVRARPLGELDRE